jgi:Xaa-Pro dipeptidase
MSTRRRFMGLSLGLGAATVLRGIPADAQTDAAGALPTSIASLVSMRKQATPITVEERAQRMARAMELMAEHKLDAIVLCGGTSTVYFTGVRWWVSERFFAIVIPAKGKPLCVCPSFEADRANEQLRVSPLKDTELFTWNEDEDPYALLGKALRSRGLTSATIGIEERVQFAFSDGMAIAMPQYKFVSASPVTAGCRMIKSAHELQLMTIANRATLAVYEAVYKALRPGMTQNEASALIDKAYERVGFRGEASVQVGEFSALPHGSMTPQIIRDGEIVMIDDGCTVEGYQSDITRTFVLGKATDKMKKVFDIVHKAQKAALDAAKPGVACEAVDGAARKIVAESGFGPDYKFFGHRVGHGIGMDGHEWPYLVRGNKLLLAPGMCFSDEPGVYIPHDFGVRLEDDMHITENGAELFTPQSPSLEDPFGKG